MQVHPHPLAEEDPQVPERVQQAPEEADQVVPEGNPQIPGDAGEARQGVADVPRDPDAERLPDGWKDYDPVKYPEVQAFRDHRNATIQALGMQTESLTNGVVNNIVSRSMLELRELLQDGRLTAVAVVSAFVKRAIQIDKHLNCITQMMDDPIRVAERLDQVGVKGPLFGLPFSIKSNFHVQGYPATVGLVKQLQEDRHPATTCRLVQHLIDQGAVPICLTNVPQGLLAYVTSNPLHGTTKNPWDLTRTPGGSSGGEAALIAAGGACFGIGNDLVGSLRIPAAFCGLVSLKPTQARVLETNMHPGPESRGRLGLSSGVFTKTVEEQQFLLRQIFGFDGQPSWQDPVVIPPEPEQRRIIAYFTDDGFAPVVPSNVRAVEDTKFKLRAEFDFEPVTLTDLCGDPFELAELLFKNVMPDNGASMNELYSGEKEDEHMKFFTGLLRKKQWSCVNWLASSTVAQSFIKFISTRGACLARSVNLSQQAAQDSMEKVNVIRTRWNTVWANRRFYALICPSFITPAQPFEYPAYLATGTFATGLFNMLDVPAGVVPVNPVTQNDVEQLAHFNTQGDLLLKWQKRAAENSAGLPNSVQVVANNEEDCLSVMSRIEAVTTGVQKLVYRYEGTYRNDEVVRSEDLFERREFERPRNADPDNNN